MLLFFQDIKKTLPIVKIAAKYTFIELKILYIEIC